MTHLCSSCKQIIVNNALRKSCGSCQQIFCSKCLYQRIAVPKLNYQMQEVCTPCYHSIGTQMMLQKPPKGFTQRLEQQQPQQQQVRMPVNQIDPETKALEERLQKLRMDFPSSSTTTAAAAAGVANTPDDLLRQMNDELSIQNNDQNALADRLRILHETMPAATPDTVILPKPKEEVADDDEDEEFPWCTVCNDNATKRCVDCDELFCESCVKKIHRQSSYKNHQLESYKPSAKAKKKYNY
ncbi:unnamed protein product [Adineta steineri]|uniref:FYVE-type domain-containing protein n=1 Tax=Adineta steineri TaxID=433720 RepID=A0A819MA48_9BILA|nr:unnamed protein product [Adineta steineri]CAF3976096.1 unnamed protein product [Adineta steineri]